MDLNKKTTQRIMLLIAFAVLLYWRHRGAEYLRLRCGDKDLRRFFARLGFYPLEGDVMEKDIRVQMPPIPAEYRP